MIQLIGYVWLILTCWLLGKAAGWLIFRHGFSKIVFVCWERQLRAITGRPVNLTVKAETARLECELGIGVYDAAPVGPTLSGDMEIISRFLQIPTQLRPNLAKRPELGGLIPVDQYMDVIRSDRPVQVFTAGRTRPVRVVFEAGQVLEAGERVISPERYRQVIDSVAHTEQLKRGRS